MVLVGLVLLRPLSLVCRRLPFLWVLTGPHLITVLVGLVLLRPLSLVCRRLPFLCVLTGPRI